MTPALVAAIEEHRRRDPQTIQGTSFAADPVLDEPTVGNPVSHGQIIQISRDLRHSEDTKPDKFHLDELLRGSMVYHAPPVPKAEHSSEYMDLMERLRRQEESRVYERMLNPAPQPQSFSERFPASPHALLSNAHPSRLTEDLDEVTYADVNRQMALIINVLLSIVACSVAIWMAASQWSTPRRLGLSMGGSGLVGVAEVVVYAGYLRRVREAKQTEKKEVETKKIVKTWVIDDQWKSLESVAHNERSEKDHAPTVPVGTKAHMD
ncbi:MAG: hypothetical protein M1837_003514 [Sclerophora amabilis]|nr:MAG: hypothetical protein M1837_003514 [Sclerophora amabilis]